MAQGDAPVHILVVPLALQGHTNPILHMLSRLSSPHFLSTIVIPEQDVARVQRSLPNQDYIRLVSIPLSVFDVGASLKTCSNTLMAHLDAMERARDGLYNLLKEEVRAGGMWSAPFSGLLADWFIHMGQDLANKLGIPRIGLWTSGAASLIISSSLECLIFDGIVPVASTEAENIPINHIPSIRNLHRDELPHSILSPADPSDLQKRVRIASRNSEAKCILINSVEELEGDIVDGLNEMFPCTSFLPIGPLLPGAFLSREKGSSFKGGEGLWKEDMHCIAWLDEQEPSSVLYISFGSLATMSREQIQQLALGLESSKQPFLWVVRPDLIVKDGEQAQDFFNGFVDRTKKQGLIISWAPQLQVLKHGSVGGFLTHCGWNSTLEALSCGMPMLCWPIFAEQNTNCKLCVHDWKVGFKFSKGSRGLVGKDEVEKVIKKLMVEDSGKVLKKNAVELGEKIRRSVDKGGSSDKNLNKLTALLSA